MAVVTTASRSPQSDARPPQAFYSITQAATMLGVSRVTMWRWITAGLVPVTRLGHRTVRIRRDDIDQLMARRRTQSTLADLPRLDLRDVVVGEHIAQFYEADEFLLDAVSHFLLPALRGGDAGIVVATPAHRAGIDERLRAAGDLDVDAAVASGQYVSLDADELLARFTVDGELDTVTFAALGGELIQATAAGGRRVRVFGEMVALLAGSGRHDAAVALEELWNALQRTHQFSLFCAYPIECFSGHELGDSLESVCGTHGRVIPTERYLEMDGVDSRMRAIAALQQKAQSLRQEVARREVVEDQLRVALAAEQSAREAAEGALRVRNEFMSVASHELKTPLTTLSGYAQVVLRRYRRDGQLDMGRALAALEAISGQAGKLGRLMNQLLDVTRLDEGQLVLDRQMADVVPLVQQLVESVRVWSGRHAISLSAPSTLPAYVDALRFEQVVSNLLDNAVKYSPDGGPIAVELAARGTWLELSVRDHGLGIQESLRPHIFERFHQAHSDSYRSGLGLGLYISNQIVELHRGQIYAESLDAGTRFFVRLPIAG